MLRAARSTVFIGDSRREEVKGVIGSTPLRQGVLGAAMWDVGSREGAEKGVR